MLSLRHQQPTTARSFGLFRIEDSGCGRQPVRKVQYATSKWRNNKHQSLSSYPANRLPGRFLSVEVEQMLQRRQELALGTQRHGSGGDIEFYE